MQHVDDPIRRFERWWTPCFVVVWLATMATFACAYYFGFGVAKPLAFLVGAMIVVLAVAGVILGPRRNDAAAIDYEHEHLRTDVNPATGLPMVDGSMFDVAGNGYGQRHQPPPDVRVCDN